MLTQDQLKECLHYDPETGVFTWRERNDVGLWWNRRYSGKRAGDVFVNPGRRGNTKYWRSRVRGRNYYHHRLAWLYMTGKWPADQIDHRNGDGLDNRWENLREATHQTNQQNARSFRNSTRHKGVHYIRRLKKKPYRAQIRYAGKNRYLGYYATADEAHAAYLAAAEQQFGQFARAA